jgi:hypothetical protein
MEKTLNYDRIWLSLFTTQNQEEEERTRARVQKADDGYYGIFKQCKPT